MKVARFRFDAGLRALLQRSHAEGEFDYRFNGPQSAKHLIESVGIPHTEIGAIVVGAAAVGMGYLVQDRDTVDVFGNAPSPISAEEPRFVIDGHLGRLAAHLRMLGFDCLYENESDDAALAARSADEARILLTRDRRLLMRKSVERGYLLRSLDPHEQLLETLRRYGLGPWIKPFQRCLRCNHPLEAISKEAVLDRLEPLTKLYFNEFRICPACRQIYWKGSHFERMQRLIASLD
jgi:uncharacterized protein with PIN domain